MSHRFEQHASLCPACDRSVEGATISQFRFQQTGIYPIEFRSSRPGMTRYVPNHAPGNENPGIHRMKKTQHLTSSVIARLRL